MGQSHYKKVKPFGLQSRRKQKSTYIDVSNQIRKAAPILGGVFTTHDYMHGQNGWIDACFLGRHARIFYNLDLQTTRYAYKEAVRNQAWDLTYKIAPEREPSFMTRAVKNPKTGLYEVPSRALYQYPELDGHSRLDWADLQQRIIADSGDIQVFEEWTVHPDYAHGVGLHATIDAPYLTIETVNTFIERFMALESDYRDPVARTYRYDQIQNWGLESNALIEPWEWKSIE